MELQIKDKLQRQQIWLPYGSYHVFSFVKIIFMVWEPPMLEQQQTLTIIQEETLFQDSKLTLKMF
jgi:hypothetical protein